MTSWMERGMERGMEQEARSLIRRLLPRKVGALPESINDQLDTLSTTQLESLAEALLDFSEPSDLEAWLS